MTTISASSTVGVTLSSTTDINPIVINQGVTISSESSDIGGLAGTAIGGTSGSWTIQNYGRLAGYGVSPSATTAAGVRLELGGSVTNAAIGLITGGYDGV